MSRESDVVRPPATGEPLPLPIVDWRAIGQAAPVPITGDYEGPDAPLPKADVVVLTWTSAEWSALDHVFLSNGTTRSKTSYEWERSWHLYTRNAGEYSTDNAKAPLWGRFRAVQVTTPNGATINVLLFKCDAHLAHPPWFKGLVQMITQILDETKASWIYSVGTAGGTREEVRLGDVVLTNAAQIQLKKQENADAPINNQSFSGKAFPATDLLARVQDQLFFPMSTVATYAALEYAVSQLHTQVPDSASFGLDDLMNGALNPANLRTSTALATPGAPLLTTDFYFIATGADAAKWSVLEMDDAVIAYVAEQRGVSYAFVRNISDPIVPNATPAGVTIPDTVRDRWSGLIYEQFGFYTSYNGALTTWAAVAGQNVTPGSAL